MKFILAEPNLWIRADQVVAVHPKVDDDYFSIDLSNGHSYAIRGETPEEFIARLHRVLEAPKW